MSTQTAQLLEAFEALPDEETAHAADDLLALMDAEENEPDLR